MKAVLQQLLSYWMQLRSREQVLLSLAAIALVFLLLFLLVWEPMMRETDRLKQSVSQQQVLVSWLQQSAQEVKRRQGGDPLNSATGRDQSLLAVIDSTAKRSRLGPAMKRVEPDGSSRVRVWMEQAVFDDLVRWLGKLQRAHGVSIDSAAIDKDTRSGRVSARFVFSDGSE